jgi:N-acetylglucosamine-6-phosphate deacetylase
VAAALVAGERVTGDVVLRGGEVDAVGQRVGPAARGIAVPGFVDWQVNGFGGVHFTDAGPEGFVCAGEALARAGMVWVAPTILNTSLTGYEQALSALTEFTREHHNSGFLGAHLEGPNLAVEFHGAHDARNFADGDASLVRRFLRAGQVSMVTLAPERRGVMEMISGWVDSGVRVSIGHSNADAATCAVATQRGASAITHCWNAHRRFSSRDPGPAGWALSNTGVTVGLVADGIHVAPEVLALTFAAAAGRVALTTDAIAPAGVHPSTNSGTAQQDHQAPPPGYMGPIVVSGGAARLPDGTLAGSVATPTRMIRVLEAAGVSFEACVHALSVPQAIGLGLAENLLRPGDPADVTVLDDDHEVLQTWRRGTRVF